MAKTTERAGEDELTGTRPAVLPVYMSRADFVAMIPNDMPALEIGPFNKPTLSGSHVRYFDILSATEIRAEAQRLGRTTTLVPDVIHYVARDTPINAIPEKFGIVYSSHCIEHTLDAIGHINSVSRLLDERGRYFLVVPDKRYCFDHYKDLSSIGALIEAHENKQNEYSLRLWIDRAVKSTHGDARRHWQGDHGDLDKGTLVERVRRAISEYKNGYRYPMNPHVWCFTPDSFKEIVEVLHRLCYIDLQVVDIFPTRPNSFEFYAVLGRF
jgi:hypothetical protein